MEAAQAKRILIVDDDQTGRHLLRFVIQLGGYDVLVARDAYEAIKLLESGEHPDLVISDMMMPGMLGSDLVQHLARYEHLQHIPIVLISAYHEVSLVGKTAAFVYKPYAPNALLGLVAQLLDEQNPPPNSTREPRLVRL